LASPHKRRGGQDLDTNSSCLDRDVRRLAEDLPLAGLGHGLPPRPDPPWGRAERRRATCPSPRWQSRQGWPRPSQQPSPPSCERPQEEPPPKERSVDGSDAALSRTCPRPERMAPVLLSSRQCSLDGTSNRTSSSKSTTECTPRAWEFQSKYVTAQPPNSSMTNAEAAA